jgi:hypothetical protein
VGVKMHFVFEFQRGMWGKMKRFEKWTKEFKKQPNLARDSLRGVECTVAQMPCGLHLTLI